MKRFLFSTLLAGLLAGGGGTPTLLAEEKTPDDIVLLVGQSNMAGRAALEKEDRGVIEGALLWNIGEGKWEPAEAPLNRYSKLRKNLGMQRLNPGVGFAKAYLEANPGKTLGIVCSARGGTRIEEWAEDQPLYMASAEAAKAALAGGGKLIAILWHQGESNSKKADTYPDKLNQLVETYRAEFDSENLPFVFGQLGQWKKDYEAFNAMIVKQTEAIPDSACVRTDGLKPFDSAHFDSPSQRELGMRYAAALAGLLEKLK